MANNLRQSQAGSYLSEIFSISLFFRPYFPDMLSAFFVTLLTLFFLIVEWVGREDKYGIELFLVNRNRLVRGLLYFLILFVYN